MALTHVNKLRQKFSGKTTRMIIRNVFNLFKPSMYVLFNRFNVINFKRPCNTRLLTGISLASSFVAFNEEEENGELITRDESVKITIPEPINEFSNTFQLQQAANKSLDSSMMLLSSTFRSWQIVHQDYLTMLERAINALNLALQVDQTVIEHLGVEEKLAKLKNDIFAHKSSMSDSLFIHQEAVKMLNLAASICFLVGNETTSGLALSHLHNVQQEVTVS